MKSPHRHPTVVPDGNPDVVADGGRSPSKSETAVEVRFINHAGEYPARLDPEVVREAADFISAQEDVPDDVMRFVDVVYDHTAHPTDRD